MPDHPHHEPEATTFFLGGEHHPHRDRCRGLFRSHPEVKRLCGYNRWTAVVLLGIVAAQTGAAWGLGRLGMHDWWLILIVAWCAGAFANHALYVLIHEATHNLIFRSRAMNQWAGIVADLPNTFPGAAGFRVYHLKHHTGQGDYRLDADLANHWEARLVGNSPIRKALWQLFFPVFQLTRPPRLKSINMFSVWTWANLACVVAYDVAIVHYCGFAGLFYLMMSFFFAIGFHPVGARWVQEHYTLDPEQETYSYYGAVNKIALNIGYHNEHHDIPSIPWNRLPTLKALAPEYYEPLKHHKSWTRLWMQFLFDRKYTLFSRVERAPSRRATLEQAEAGTEASKKRSDLAAAGVAQQRKAS